MRTYIFLLSLMSVGISYAISPVDVVQSFGENLSNWCKTKDIRYCDAMKDLASGNKAFRVSDQIIKDYPPKGLENTQANFNNYITVFQNNIHDGISVTYSNIKLDNSPVYGIDLFGNQDAPKCVSCDIHIAGALKYDIKDIFYVRDNKIVAIADYYSDQTFNTGLLLCKQKRYREALDVFEQIIQTPFDYHEEEQAKNFALSLLMKKSDKLDLGKHVIKYKIARLFYKTQRLLNTTPMLPLLDENNYDVAMRTPLNAKTRVIQLPLHLYETIPYWEGSLGLCDRDYCRYIYTDFRPIEKTRFAIKKKNLFGYVDENDKVIISPQFLFAYPFDERHGLAAVQGRDGKWGYIDTQGRPRTAMNYDVVSDVWVKDKTLVIKDGYLILINNQGQIIKSVYGYTDIAHKLDQDVTLVKKSCENIQYDLTDFNGNILAEDIFNNKDERVKKIFTDYNVNSIFKCYKDVLGCSLSYDTYNKVIGAQIPNPDNLGMGKIVDLGLSVKWAAWNIGAKSPEEEGLHCGWGDPTGKDQTGKTYKEWKKKVVNEKTNEWISPSYGGPNPPANICGTSLDVAKNLWGKGWRLPSVAECKELKEKCVWQKATFKGVEGYLITGPTGNSIFMKSMQYAGYWTGELYPKWKNNAVEFRDGIIVEQNVSSRAGGVGGCWFSDCYRPCVRPVYEL